MKKILFSILLMMSCTDIYAAKDHSAVKVSEVEVSEKAPLSTHAQALEMNRDFPSNIFVQNQTSIDWREVTATFGATWTSTSDESEQGTCTITLRELACQKMNGLVQFTKHSIFDRATKAFSESFSREQEQGLFGGIVSIQSVTFNVQGGSLNDIVNGRYFKSKTQGAPFAFDYNNFENLYTLKESDSNLVLTVSENN